MIYMDAVQKVDGLPKTNIYTEVTPRLRTAIMGRCAEGTPWAARDKETGTVFFYAQRPTLCGTRFEQTVFEWNVGTSESPIYNFITFENSPIDLLYLIISESE